LDDALNHLNGAAVLFDDNGEGGSLDHSGQHRSVNCKVRDACMLDLEQHGAEHLDYAREPGGRRLRW
jgi:hypothetical protein